MLPLRISPMLAQAADGPFDSPKHLFEIKWDGTRCIAFVERQRRRLQNRRHIEMRQCYPELAGLRRLPNDSVLDGEVVVLQDGKPSFAKLQQREHVQDPTRIEILSRRLPATLIAFDLLFRRGREMTDRPLTERRQVLADLVADLDDAHVIVSEHVHEHGVKFFRAIKEHGFEGVMAKRLDSPYFCGKRSRHWLKIKVARTTDFEVIGYVPMDGQEAISSLLLAERAGDRLIYKGKVGSGFTRRQRREFFCELAQAAIVKNAPPDCPDGAVLRSPGWRCLVRFFELTRVGRLRGPVFKGFV